MSDLNSAIQEMSQYFGFHYEDLTLEFMSEISSLGIIIRTKASSSSFISVTYKNGLGYIDMFQAESQGQGIGTKLMVSMIDILKRLGCKTLSGHITHIGVLKILAKLYGRNTMKLYKKSLFGLGASLTYEEAESMANSGGFIIFVDI
jgi:GNAT superfamily N-acetyltransferase